jgi:hypothetical protein
MTEFARGMRIASYPRAGRTGSDPQPPDLMIGYRPALLFLNSRSDDRSYLQLLRCG